MYYKLTIVGRLGQVPTMRLTRSGEYLTRFCVAAERTTTKNDQKVKETTWFHVSVFGKQIDSCIQYLHKGSMVLIDGALSIDPETGGPRLWTDRKGKTRASFDVIGYSVQCISPGVAGRNAVTSEVATRKVLVASIDPDMRLGD